MAGAWHFWFMPVRFQPYRFPLMLKMRVIYLQMLICRNVSTKFYELKYF